MAQHAAPLRGRGALLPEGELAWIVGPTVYDILARHANEKS